MTIYENVKANVSMKQVAEHNGLKVTILMIYLPHLLSVGIDSL